MDRKEAIAVFKEYAGRTIINSKTGELEVNIGFTTATNNPFSKLVPNMGNHPIIEAAKVLGAKTVGRTVGDEGGIVTIPINSDSVKYGINLWELAEIDYSLGIKRGSAGAGGEPSPLALAFELNKRVVGMTRETFGRNSVTDTLLKGFVGATEGAMGFVDKIVQSRQPRKPMQDFTSDEIEQMTTKISKALASGNVGRGPSIFGDDTGKNGR